MPVEQALEELRKYAKDFAAVGDAKQAIKNNKDDFIHKYIKVMQYFNYIFKYAKSSEDELCTAVDIIYDIIDDNPSLEEWVTSMIEPKKKNKQEQNQTQENTSVDIASISNQIESYVSEIRNMYSWDPDYASDIEWKLQEYQKVLVSNKSYFDSSVYQSLMNDIDASLDKIARYNNMLNSEVMEDIRTR